jgi:hypothetical protein
MPFDLFWMLSGSKKHAKVLELTFSSHIASLVSSEPCVEPVTTKNGDVYERRLIEKHIAITGIDPVTKQPLTVEDLIPLKGTS